MPEDDALAIHALFLHMLDDGAPIEHVLLRIRSVTQSLQSLPQTSWKEALPMYIRMADGRIPPAQPQMADAFNILNILCVLVALSPPTARPRLQQTIDEMCGALQVIFDKNAYTLQTTEQSAPQWQAMQEVWKGQWSMTLQPLLRRWVRSQLSLSLFPFAGAGEDAVQRITIIAIRFATVRLALMSACVMYEGVPPQTEIVRIVQSLARFYGSFGRCHNFITIIYTIRMDARSAVAWGAGYGINTVCYFFSRLQKRSMNHRCNVMWRQHSRYLCRKRRS
jgi:hypothetical protein